MKFNDLLRSDPLLTPLLTAVLAVLLAATFSSADEPSAASARLAAVEAAKYLYQKMADAPGVAFLKKTLENQEKDLSVLIGSIEADRQIAAEWRRYLADPWDFTPPKATVTPLMANYYLNLKIVELLNKIPETRKRLAVAQLHTARERLAAEAAEFFTRRLISRYYPTFFDPERDMPVLKEVLSSEGVTQGDRQRAASDLYASARSLEARGKPLEAYTLLEGVSFLRHWPDGAKAMRDSLDGVVKGMVREDLKRQLDVARGGEDTELEIRLLGQLIALSPGDIDLEKQQVDAFARYYTKRAADYFAEQKYHLAKREIAEIVEQVPDYQPARDLMAAIEKAMSAGSLSLLLGQIGESEQSEDWPRVLELAEKALDLDPDNGDLKNKYEKAGRIVTNSALKAALREEAARFNANRRMETAFPDKWASIGKALAAAADAPLEDIETAEQVSALRRELHATLLALLEKEKTRNPEHYVNGLAGYLLHSQAPERQALVVETVLKTATERFDAALRSEPSGWVHLAENQLDQVNEPELKTSVMVLLARAADRPADRDQRKRLLTDAAGQLGSVEGVETAMKLAAVISDAALDTGNASMLPAVFESLERHPQFSRAAAAAPHALALLAGKALAADWDEGFLKYYDLALPRHKNENDLNGLVMTGAGSLSGARYYAARSSGTMFSVSALRLSARLKDAGTARFFQRGAGENRKRISVSWLNSEILKADLKTGGAITLEDIFSKVRSEATRQSVMAAWVHRLASDRQFERAESILDRIKDTPAGAEGTFGYCRHRLDSDDRPPAVLLKAFAGHTLAETRAMAFAGAAAAFNGFTEAGSGAPRKAYSTLGIQLGNYRNKQGTLKISGCYPGTPAHDAGIPKGYHLAALNGVPVTSRGRTLARMMSLPVGSSVELTLQKGKNKKKKTMAMRLTTAAASLTLEQLLEKTSR